jgi:hypothetical protein
VTHIRGPSHRKRPASDPQGRGTATYRTQYDFTSNVIIDKYGQPDKVEIKTYQNRFGAIYQGEVATWVQVGAIITLTEMEYKDSSSFIIRDRGPFFIWAQQLGCQQTRQPPGSDDHGCSFHLAPRLTSSADFSRNCTSILSSLASPPINARDGCAWPLHSCMSWWTSILSFVSQVLEGDDCRAQLAPMWALNANGWVWGIPEV